ncbi:YhbD family protein [Paenibacillus mendelii]|uniref:YhbD family protein n=1 Tax=Paenibacillus mendelii TaxID=206163 RepID=A0ABV6JFK0_9BACL|nr:YhbD family protein [Paenibacillus mendelii]MCQ6562612.1 YhbD family protein [Paenibacillus mendelii]
MDTELISKKDLLELMNISYGQLYRWKRKQLIPEEWFIRKSTFTGQETFFPKAQILSRIGKIIAMKDDLSLDEVAGKLSPLLYDLRLRREEIIERNIVSSLVMDRLGNRADGDGTYSFERMLFLFTADKLLQTGEMNLEEGGQLLQTLQEHFSKFEGKGCDLVFIRKMGVSAFALISASGELYFEGKVKLVARLSMTVCLEELKTKLT